MLVPRESEVDAHQGHYRSGGKCEHALHKERTDKILSVLVSALKDLFT